MAELPRKHEGEKLQTRLDRLDANKLIPDTLKSEETLVGKPVMIARREEGNIEFVIRDEQKVSLKDIGRFEYLFERLEEWPELAVGPGTYYRPLVYGSITELSPTVLFGGMMETNPEFRGKKGIGIAFTENLLARARELGYRFFGGYHNNAQIARFFLNRGNYLLEEIKDTHRHEFEELREQEPDESVFHTVNFLKPDDVQEYVRPERIGVRVDDRIEYKEKSKILSKIFENLEILLKKVETNAEQTGDKATLIEICEDLNDFLPEQDRYALPVLSEDDGDIVEPLKKILEHLKSSSSFLLQNCSLEELEENSV